MSLSTIASTLAKPLLTTPQLHMAIAATANGLCKVFARQSRGLKWSVEQEPHHQFKPVTEIIREPEIMAAIENTQKKAQDVVAVQDILDKAKDHALLKDIKPGSEYIQGLDLMDTATLLNIPTERKDLLQKLYDTAFYIKNLIYGNRIVLFAPVYLSNYCVNSCTYCAFRYQNKDSPRSMLTDEDLVHEVEALQRQGHRRLLLLTGESPKYTFDHFLKALKIVSEVRTEPCGNIRRINVEIPTLSVSDFRRLKQTDCVGTFTLFQETYDRNQFKRFHPSGPKSDYDHRVLTFDRAQTAGVDDVGLGALFGLSDFRFEILALLQHAQHLEATYGAGPHTISVPRMQPAENAPDALTVPNPVSDDDFRKMVATIRCAVPYTGMILSTRESPEIRQELLKLGISQMSAGSKTDVGSYHKGDGPGEERIRQAYRKGESSGLAQFSLQDTRSTDEVVHDLLERGFLPSWCTACYRKKRTGEAFMKIAKKGDIQNFCHPNGLLTLEEYLEDYASEKTKELGRKVVARESEFIPSERARGAYERKLEKVKKGSRDLYF